MASSVRKFWILAAGLAAVTISAPALADVLVVRSLGPSAGAYAPGRSLPNDTTLNLRAGDMVTVLGPAGTRIFRGPGTYRVTGPSQVSPLARAMAGQDRRRRIGAVRGSGSGDAAHAGLWDVDVTRSGTVCVVEGSPITFWRPNSREQASLSIRAGENPDSRLHWPAGSASIAWRAPTRIQADTEYQVELEPLRQATRIRFAPLRTSPRDDMALAGQLIEHGCQLQLDRLLESAPVD